MLEIGYITHALAAALDYAHVRGVIHRVIKPANIMFNAEGQIVLTDFGIVHIMGDTVVQPTGTVLRTPPTWPRNRPWRICRPRQRHLCPGRCLV
ncbi:MAG: protein kinase [Chloroflexi bacterium]|nr:protein kinase [Chloroflexota bacterium]